MEIIMKLKIIMEWAYMCL